MTSSALVVEMWAALLMMFSSCGPMRLLIRAMPASGEGAPLTGLVGDWLSKAASSVTGNVVTSAVEVHARDEERQAELDSRIIPFLPSGVQIAYLGSLLAGLLGWPVARAWWERIWPRERPEDYRGAAGYRAAQAARLLVFLAVFLPLAGVPALIGSLALHLWGVAALPIRFLRWLTARSPVKAG